MKQEIAIIFIVCEGQGAPTERWNRLAKKDKRDTVEPEGDIHA
jgi:hypothetical protein